MRSMPLRGDGTPMPGHNADQRKNQCHFWECRSASHNGKMGRYPTSDGIIFVPSLASNTLRRVGEVCLTPLCGSSA